MTVGNVQGTESPSYSPNQEYGSRIAVVEEQIETLQERIKQLNNMEELTGVGIYEIQTLTERVGLLSDKKSDLENQRKEYTESNTITFSGITPKQPVKESGLGDVVDLYI